jgi:methyl-accepting chemotaxis protein
MAVRRVLRCAAAFQLRSGLKGPEMKISAVTKLAGAAVVGGIVAVIAANAIGSMKLRVGGVVYSHIVDGKDLIGDILPPPEYIIEPYLEATLAVNDPANVKTHRERLTSLRKDFDQRLAYWKTKEIDPAVRDLLTRQAAEPALKFWSITEGSLLPALENGDADAARAAYAELTQAYNAHRAKIDETVDAATKMNKATEENAAQQAREMDIIIWSVAALVLLIAASSVFALLFGLVRPLNRLKLSIAELGKGNFDVNPTLGKRSDELGEMSSALQTMVEKLREVVSDALAASRSVSSNSAEVASSAQDLSSGASEQAAAGEEASATMEQMAASIKQNADNASQTEKIARQSANGAEGTGEAVARAVEAMKTIAGKIHIIQEIARQTDLLALNAAVEAARAGEHGRGFSVVASEVRKLAERSQTAAQEIGTLSGETVSVAQAAGDKLNKLVPDIKKTAGLISEISAACREQDSGAGEINIAIQQLDKVIQRNAASAEELSATSEELAAQSEKLLDSISFFRVSGKGGVPQDGAQSKSAKGGSRPIKLKAGSEPQTAQNASPAAAAPGGALIDLGEGKDNNGAGVAWY